MSEVSADEDSLPSTFSLGDLAWARVGKASYWPCVISIDPDTSKHTHVKMQRRNTGSLKREYHVQFFGQVQRAWVVSSSMLKFEGLEAFKELARSMQSHSKSIRQALRAPSNANQKEMWSLAVEECEALSGKSNLERSEMSLELMRTQSSTAASSKKRRRTSLDVSQPSSKKAKKVLDEAEKLIEAIPLKTLEENRRKLKTGFKLFQLAHKKEVQKAHGLHNMEKAMSKMWNILTATEKRFYQDKASDLVKPSEPALSEAKDSPRPSEAVSKKRSSIGSVQTPRLGQKANSVVTKADKMIGLFKKESCCLICEEVSQEPKDLVKCKGICGGTSFHISCLPKEHTEPIGKQI